MIETQTLRIFTGIFFYINKAGRSSFHAHIPTSWWQPLGLSDLNHHPANNKRLFWLNNYLLSELFCDIKKSIYVFFVLPMIHVILSLFRAISVHPHANVSTKRFNNYY